MDHKILYLGPPFTFSHQAAEEAIPFVNEYLNNLSSYKDEEHQYSLLPQKTNEEMEAVLRTDADAFAVVPISNSEMGDVYRFLPFCSYEKLTEVKIDVSFCLCSKSSFDKVQKIATMTVAYGQVKDELMRVISDRSIDTSTLISANMSTADAADFASKDETIAAICSERAAEHYGLTIHASKLEGASRRQTTFYVFRNTHEVNFTPSHQIASDYSILLRGAHIYSGTHSNAGKQAFANLLESKKTLRVKWGLDPIYDTLHLGHLSNLLKLRDFINCGHKVIIVFGTFTGIIADPSGNLTQRPPIKAETLEINTKKILPQIERVLGSNNFEIIYNNDLIENFDLRQFLQWLRSTDIRYIQDRPDFINRMNFMHKLSVAEFIYPLFQAFDTVHIKPDIELGGADQIWNCVLGKNIMKQEGFQVPLVLLVDELNGIDGSLKMSAFSGNAIYINDTEHEIRTKILTISPNLLYAYCVALTRIDYSDLMHLKAAIESKADLKKWKDWLATEVINNINMNG